jgi:hypothetical protein
MSRNCHRLPFCAVLLCIACGGNSVTAPTPTVPPFGVSGIVSSAAGPVPHATVEATTGPQKGAVTITDDAGRFTFGAIFTSLVSLRASKDGYRDQLIVATGGQTPLAFRLVLPANFFEPASVTQIRFDADAMCTGLPPQLRSRTYAISFASRGGPWYIGTLSGADFGKALPGAYPGYDWNGLSVRITDDTAEFYASDPPIWEMLSAQSDLLIYVSAQGIIQADALQWTFSGSFAYCADSERDEGYPECKVPEVACRSQSHRLTLIRR